jgi:hypothetical protein
MLNSLCAADPKRHATKNALGGGPAASFALRIVLPTTVPRGVDKLLGNSNCRTPKSPFLEFLAYPRPDQDSFIIAGGSA